MLSGTAFRPAALYHSRRKKVEGNYTGKDRREEKSKKERRVMKIR